MKRVLVTGSSRGIGRAIASLTAALKRGAGTRGVSRENGEVELFPCDTNTLIAFAAGEESEAETEKARAYRRYARRNARELVGTAFEHPALLRLLCTRNLIPPGTAEDYPVKAPPRPRHVEQRAVLLLRCGDRWAIRRREKKGLLAGLWEFPNEEGRPDEAALRERFPQALAIVPCGEAKHVFTHVEWHMEGWRIELPEELDGLMWERAGEIRARYSVPTALKAYLAQIV